MDLEIIKKIIRQHQGQYNDFAMRAIQSKGYYRNETDILMEPLSEKKDRDEKPLRNADNRIPFNFHGLLVNQKAAYMFTAPPLFDLGAEEANKQLQTFLGDKFPKVCKDLCIEASNCSVGWIHLWKDRGGIYKYAMVSAQEVIPVWTKGLEKELQGVLRIHSDTDQDGDECTVYEYWNDTVCQSYEVKAGYELEEGILPYTMFTDIDTHGKRNQTNIFKHGIGEVPFFPFFNNNIDTGDLKNNKALIDTYCKVFSGFVNDLEDIQEVIFVLTNYGGENLGQFLRELKDYKAIQVDSGGGDDKSGVSTLTIELPVEARKELLAATRKCIFEQGQGIDPDPQNFGNSSGIALNFLYSLLELKAGLQETEFKLAFGRFIRCVCRLHGIPIKDNSIVQVWTRTAVNNDSELADIALKSVGVISNQTIIKNHPWVEDPKKEQEQIRKEQAEEAENADPYRQAFGGMTQNPEEDPEGGGIDGEGKPDKR